MNKIISLSKYIKKIEFNRSKIDNIHLYQLKKEIGLDVKKNFSVSLEDFINFSKYENKVNSIFINEEFVECIDYLIKSLYFNGNYSIKDNKIRGLIISDKIYNISIDFNDKKVQYLLKTESSFNIGKLYLLKDGYFVQYSNQKDSITYSLYNKRPINYLILKEKQTSIYDNDNLEIASKLILERKSVGQINEKSREISKYFRCRDLILYQNFDKYFAAIDNSNQEKKIPKDLLFCSIDEADFKSLRKIRK